MAAMCLIQLVFFLLLSAFRTAEGMNCSGSPTGNPVFNPANGHYYCAYLGDYSANEAMILAHTLNYNGLSGYLATIYSNQESDWIDENVLLKATGYGYWLGAQGLDDQSYMWNDGPESGHVFWTWEGLCQEQYWDCCSCDTFSHRYNPVGAYVRVSYGYIGIDSSGEGGLGALVEFGNTAYDATTQMTYQYVSVPTTWPAAMSSAYSSSIYIGKLSQFGSMGVLQTSEEWMFISQYAVWGKSDGMWFGAQNSNGWAWVGESSSSALVPFTDTSGNCLSSSYCNWAPGEPASSGLFLFSSNNMWYGDSSSSSTRTYAIAYPCPLQCLNGGTVDFYCAQCQCSNEWTGTSCAQCGLSCQNGGTSDASCVQCQCTNNWSGSTCSVCPLTCANGQLNSASCSCQCDTYWSGLNCDVCAFPASACLNGGIVNSVCDGCVCPSPWSGLNCSICTLSCSNGGMQSSDCMECACPGNWEGTTCATCGLNCGPHGLSDSNCTFCSCMSPWTGSQCQTCGLEYCKTGFQVDFNTCSCVPIAPPPHFYQNQFCADLIAITKDLPFPPLILTGKLTGHVCYDAVAQAVSLTTSYSPSSGGLPIQLNTIQLASSAITFTFINGTNATIGCTILAPPPTKFVNLGQLFSVWLQNTTYQALYFNPGTETPAEVWATASQFSQATIQTAEPYAYLHFVVSDPSDSYSVVAELGNFVAYTSSSSFPPGTFLPPASWNCGV